MSVAGIGAAKCVLVVGATAGIGRALALAIHQLPSKPTVIVSGRRQERLDELTRQGERVASARVDLTSGRESLQAFANDTISKYPDLDAIILSSGVQHTFDFTKPESIDLDLFETEFTTNYIAIVTLIKIFMPHFLKLSDQGRPSFIIPVTSSLGILPGPWVPAYSATKAALHSFSLSLDEQLRKKTKVQVMEIIPPLVESELHDHQGTTSRLSKFWMPLDTFTKETMQGLCRGDMQIAPGEAKGRWEKWEKSKIDTLRGHNMPS